MARKKKRPGLFARLLDALLSAIDWLCESAAGLFVGALRAVGLALAYLVRVIARLVGCLARLLLAPFAWAMRKLRGRHNRAAQCLRLDGHEFESYVALVLADNGFKHVKITKCSGDQGVDILAERNGKSYAIQCKNYAGAVGNFAVQEAYAGAQFYGCEQPAVICPGTFTRGAKELAASTGVLLWDGKRLSRMMRISGRRPRHRA